MLEVPGDTAGPALSEGQVDYADDDPNEVVAEEPLASGGDDLERDAVLGAGAVDLVLTKVLDS